MKTLTVSTCGTSILTNYSPDEDKKFLNDNANKSEQDFSPEDEARLKAIVGRKRDSLLSAPPEQVKRLSAELNGFITYYEQTSGLDEAKNDTHYIIHSDTQEGREVAEIIRLWGEANGINMIPMQIDDFNTKNVEEFRLGVNNLVQFCADTLPGFREQGYQVIFNLVGGFKALQGYMQTLGMFYADETVYIFEPPTRELLRIPRMPADFTAQAKQAVLDNLGKFRVMQKETLSREECRDIPETLLDILDDRCSLSAWGRVIFEEVQRSAYSEKLLEPLSERIIISRTVRDCARDLPPDRLLRLNQAIDKLSRQIDKGEFLRSCNLRVVKGDPVPPSTHEFNLWPDMGGWRGFCHWENQNLIIDDVDMGLRHQ